MCPTRLLPYIYKPAEASVKGGCISIYLRTASYEALSVGIVYSTSINGSCSWWTNRAMCLSDSNSLSARGEEQNTTENIPSTKSGLEF